MKENTDNTIKKGKFLRSLLITIIIMLLIVTVCAGINILLDKINISDIDITKEKLYTLSQESKDKVANVSKDTKIILYNMDDYSTVETFAELYSKENSHITYEKLTDASQRPDLEMKYGIGYGVDNLIVVENDERIKAVTTNDLYTTDYNTYESIDTTEQALTNAILDVNLSENPNVYFVTNHIKYSGAYESAKELLKNEANKVQDLDLLVEGKIPEDCKVLVITTLKEDFSEYEKELITAYIENGGNVMIMTEPNYSKVDLTNFNAILSLYGVSVSDGVIFETLSGRTINGYPNFIIPYVNSSMEITQYISSDGAVALMNCGKIASKSFDELTDMGVVKNDILTTSSGTFLRNDMTSDSTSKIDSDEDAGNSTVASVLTRYVGGKEPSNLVLFSSDFFASDMYVVLNGSQGSAKATGISFYNNKDLVINSVSYLTERTDNITIRKDTGVTLYTATEQQDRIIKIIITVLPIAIVLIGIIVWQKRKRQK